MHDTPIADQAVAAPTLFDADQYTTGPVADLDVDVVTGSDGGRWTVDPTLFPDVEKICRECRLMVDLGSYAPCSTSRDGRGDTCQACIETIEEERRDRAAANARAWYESNPERAAANARAWRESNLERAAATDRARYEANRDRAAATGRAWYEANRDRKAATNRAWYESNPERAAANARAWRESNLERAAAASRARYARKRAATVAGVTCGHDETQARVATFGARCWICGADYEHVDHVKPLAAGGLHIPANLRPACAECNMRKQAKWPFPTTQAAAFAVLYPVLEVSA